MTVEHLVRRITRKSDQIKFSEVKLDSGTPRLFREVGGKNDPLFNDGWDEIYAPGGYLPKEELPQEFSPLPKSRIRNTRHGKIKL